MSLLLETLPELLSLKGKLLEHEINRIKIPEYKFRYFFNVSLVQLFPAFLVLKLNVVE